MTFFTLLLKISWTCETADNITVILMSMWYNLVRAERIEEVCVFSFALYSVWIQRFYVVLSQQHKHLRVWSPYTLSRRIQDSYCDAQLLFCSSASSLSKAAHHCWVGGWVSADLCESWGQKGLLVNLQAQAVIIFKSLSLLSGNGPQRSESTAFYVAFCSPVFWGFHPLSRISKLRSPWNWVWCGEQEDIRGGKVRRWRSNNLTSSDLIPAHAGVFPTKS